MNLEEKMKQELCQELSIPDEVEEKLNEAYRQILKGKPLSANSAHTRQKNRRTITWTAAAAAAAIVFAAGSLLFSQPSLARDLPIIGNLFKLIQDTNSRTDPKDKTAYEQIEKYSKKAAVPENDTGAGSQKNGRDTDSGSEKSGRNPENSSAEPGTVTEDNGVEVMVSDVYFDGYDLYYTLSIRTEDEDLNSSEFLTPLNFIEEDPLPFFASAFLNGTEVTSIFLQPRKSEDGSFVQLVRISMDSAGLASTDPLEVRLDFNAVGGTRLEDIGTYEGAYQEAMGHKTIRGNWKLAFQISADQSGTRRLVSPSEDQGFTVAKAAATPSNLHLTILIPNGWDANTLIPQIFDSAGGQTDWEHISCAADPSTGQPLLEITANAAEASQYVVKIVDKTSSTGDMLRVIAEIPFELQ